MHYNPYRRRHKASVGAPGLIAVALYDLREVLHRMDMEKPSGLYMKYGDLEA